MAYTKMLGIRARTDDASIPNRTIVILGSFNPSIIQPSFLRRFKILPEQEIRAAEAETVDSKSNIGVALPRLLISGGQTILIFKSLLFDVSRDKFQVTIRAGSDLSVTTGALKKLFSVLEFTPVSAIGFNFTAHWRTEGGLQKLDSLFTGDQKKFRRVFGTEVTVGGRLRFESLGAKVLLETEPSYRMAEGVFFNFNFHYDLSPNSVQSLIKVLPNYEKTLERAKEIAISLYGPPSSILPFEEVFQATGESQK
jgi:hypothetical protein